MDDDLVGPAGDEDNDLEQVADGIWADDEYEPPIGVFAEVINGKRVGDRSFAAIFVPEPAQIRSAE